MNVVRFSKLSGNIRESIQGFRWVILQQEDIPKALSVMMFAELDGVLVAVDHRKSVPENGLWVRAVHLLLVSEAADADEIRQITGITKVVSCDASTVEDHLW